MSSRTNYILSVLSEKKKIDVSELSDKLNVSQVTIRKDLDELESRGIIKREHGYAILKNENDISSRLAFHYEEKRDIARKASELVENGSAIIIESGSCCACLAEVLAEEKDALTVITNSSFIASCFRQKPDFQVILLGGIFQPDSQVNVGPMIKQCAENFNVEYMFIGVDGYSAKSGFTNKDSLRSQAVRDMALSAEKIIVLTESTKFSHPGNTRLKCDNQIYAVITDSKIDGATKSNLENNNIKVILT